MTTLIKFSLYAGLLFGALFSMSFDTFAQKMSRQKPKSEKAADSSILDFEGDTIEGQRRRPDLFLQTETQNLTLDAILYLRKDFNDFHQIEKNRRPSYFERKSK